MKSNVCDATNRRGAAVANTSNKPSGMCLLRSVATALQSPFSLNMPLIRNAQRSHR
jgi:hypothetical protein